MKHIKKFSSISDASGFIMPNPFIGMTTDQIVWVDEDNKKNIS